MKIHLQMKVMVLIVLLIVGVMSAFAQEEPVLLEARFYDVHSFGIVRDGSGGVVVLARPGDVVEVLAYVDNNILVNVYRPIEERDVVEFLGFGWFDYARYFFEEEYYGFNGLELRSRFNWVTTQPRMTFRSDPPNMEVPCLVGEEGEELSSRVVFGEQYIWSLSSAGSCNILAESSSNNEYYYWGIRDFDTSDENGREQYTNGNGTFFFEGSVRLYPATMNVSSVATLVTPVALQRAAEKRTGGYGGDLFIYVIEGGRVAVRDFMLDR